MLEARRLCGGGGVWRRRRGGGEEGRGGVGWGWVGLGVCGEGGRGEGRTRGEGGGRGGGVCVCWEVCMFVCVGGGGVGGGGGGGGADPVLMTCVYPYDIAAHAPDWGGKTPGSQTPGVPATLGLNVQKDGGRRMLQTCSNLLLIAATRVPATVAKKNVDKLRR